MARGEGHHPVAARLMTNRPGRTAPWLIGATWWLLALHAAAMVTLCWQQKLTPDEANYVLAGCILRHDMRFDVYNTVLHGPLALWPNQLGVLFADPADIGAYAPFGRLGLVPFTLLAAHLVHTLAQRAFGAKVAVAALIAWVTNPLVLAHGCLMTADMALTCTSLWTVERTWRFLAAPSLPRVLWVGVALGVTLATKYLGLLLVPTLGLVLLWALLRGFAPRLLWSRQRSARWARGLDALLAGALVAATAGLTLHSCYLWQPPRFEVNLPPPGVEVAAEDSAYGPKSSALGAVATTSVGRAALELLPEPFVRGIDYQKQVSEGLPTFFGDRVAPGFWTYYLVAFGTKLPLVFLGLLLLGIVVRRPPWPPHLAPVTLLAVAVPLFFLSGITRLQIGVRYALPAVPFLCLLVGRGLGWLWSHSRPLQVAAAAAGAALIVGAGLTWPSYLTAFNALAPRPYLWFKDSTLDWRVPGLPDADLLALQTRHPDAQVIDGAIGPSLGKRIIHGEQLAPRDPRDAARIHHWLRRYWPIDSAGAWFAFVIDEATFGAAVAREPTDLPRARAEFAAALVAAREPTRAAPLLHDNRDPGAALVAAAAVDLDSGDPAHAAAAFLQLGRPDLVLGLGEGAPRPLRAQALLALHQPEAVIALLPPTVSLLAPTETYVLAAALAEAGRGPEALILLDAATPTEASARAVHERIVLRLRQLLQASDRADRAYLRR